MKRSEIRVCEATLRRLLRQAAAESVVATAEYCMARPTGEPVERGEVVYLEETLAWIAARVTERGWDLLPADADDARAPIAWAVQEIVEWAEHMVLYEALGDRECRLPLTWLPRGTHPLGTRDADAAVAERADLLRQELRDHGVHMAVEEAEVAA